MPSKLIVNITYNIIGFLNYLSKKLESNLWGYKWCSKCKGDGKFPNSGMWEQPDGYKICPKCYGHRWE